METAVAVALFCSFLSICCSAITAFILIKKSKLDRLYSQQTRDHINSFKKDFYEYRINAEHNMRNLEASIQDEEKTEVKPNKSIADMIKKMKDE